MHVLYLDEFGHEDTLNKKQSPVFGYGGFLMPAENVSSFATHFFDLKIVANVNKIKRKNTAISNEISRAEEGVVQNRANIERKKRALELQQKLISRLDQLSQDKIIQDPEIRHLSAKYEVKGDEAFAKSYIVKKTIASKMGDRRARKQLKGLTQFGKYFLRTLENHDGESFYCGFHRSRAPQLKKDEKIHVRIIEDVLEAANSFAKSHNTTVKIVFDRHHTDGNLDDRLELNNTLPGRLEFARRTVMRHKYYDNITEPIFTTKSHWSQGVQAADWLAYMLGLTWSHRTGGKKYKNLKLFYEGVGKELISNTCDYSSFKSHNSTDLGRVFPKQTELDLEPIPPHDSKAHMEDLKTFIRPYHRRD